jgi:hypothetical protein
MVHVLRFSAAHPTEPAVVVPPGSELHSRRTACGVAVSQVPTGVGDRYLLRVLSQPPRGSLPKRLGIAKVCGLCPFSLQGVVVLTIPRSPLTLHDTTPFTGAVVVLAVPRCVARLAIGFELRTELEVRLRLWFPAKLARHDIGQHHTNTKRPISLNISVLSEPLAVSVAQPA